MLRILSLSEYLFQATPIHLLSRYPFLLAFLVFSVFLLLFLQFTQGTAEYSAPTDDIVWSFNKLQGQKEAFLKAQFGLSSTAGEVLSLFIFHLHNLSTGASFCFISSFLLCCSFLFSLLHSLFLTSPLLSSRLLLSLERQGQCSNHSVTQLNKSTTLIF